MGDRLSAHSEEEEPVVVVDEGGGDPPLWNARALFTSGVDQMRPTATPPRCNTCRRGNARRAPSCSVIALRSGLTTLARYASGLRSSRPMFRVRPRLPRAVADAHADAV
jgi:hypothetical protein